MSAATGKWRDALGISPSTVAGIFADARSLGLDAASVEALTNAELEARLYSKTLPSCLRPEPDCAALHLELRQSPVMRRVHVAGDKLFVDYAGMKPRIVDPVTGEITEVELFVAVLGASNYTFAEASLPSIFLLEGPVVFAIMLSNELQRSRPLTPVTTYASQWQKRHARLIVAE